MENHVYHQPKERCVHTLVYLVVEGIIPLLNIDPDCYSYLELVVDIC